MVDTEAQGEPVREALTVELAAAEREGDTVKVGLSEALSVADCVYVPDTVPQGVGAGEEVREGDREGEGVKVVVTLAVEDAVKQPVGVEEGDAHCVGDADTVPQVLPDAEGDAEGLAVTVGVAEGQEEAQPDPVGEGVLGTLCV